MQFTIELLLNHVNQFLSIHGTQIYQCRYKVLPHVENCYFHLNVHHNAKELDMQTTSHKNSSVYELTINWIIKSHQDLERYPYFSFVISSGQ